MFYSIEAEMGGVHLVLSVSFDFFVIGSHVTVQVI